MNGVKRAIKIPPTLLKMGRCPIFDKLLFVHNVVKLGITPHVKKLWDLLGGMDKIPTSRKIDVKDFLPNLESRHIHLLEFFFFEDLLFPLLMVYISM
jgi:hypothetical protein